jgi:hypothetical protein
MIDPDERDDLEELVKAVDTLIEANRDEYLALINKHPNVRSKQIVGLLHYLLSTDKL